MTKQLRVPDAEGSGNFFEAVNFTKAYHRLVPSYAEVWTQINTDLKSDLNAGGNRCREIGHRRFKSQ